MSTTHFTSDEPRRAGARGRTSAPTRRAETVASGSPAGPAAPLSMTNPAFERLQRRDTGGISRLAWFALPIGAAALAAVIWATSQPTGGSPDQAVTTVSSTTQTTTTHQVAPAPQAAPAAQAPATAAASLAPGAALTPGAAETGATFAVHAAADTPMPTRAHRRAGVVSHQAGAVNTPAVPAASSVPAPATAAAPVNPAAASVPAPAAATPAPAPALAAPVQIAPASPPAAADAPTVGPSGSDRGATAPAQ